MDSQDSGQMSSTKQEHKMHDHQKHQEPRQENTHKILIGAAVVQVLLLIFISFQISNLGSVNAVDNGALPAAGQGAPSAPVVNMEQLADDDAVLGDEDAPVTIIEFSDYQCPFCKRFHTDTFPQLNEEYIKTGKVKFIYRDFPLGFHQNAQKAAEAAECAGEQGKYYEMHEKLFTMGNGDGSGLNPVDLKKCAQELKLDTGKFNTCLDSSAMRQEVAKDLADGQRAGVQGTPGFFVNGQEISGAQPFGAFQAVIEAELSR